MSAEAKKQLFWHDDLVKLQYIRSVGESYIDLDFVYNTCTINIGLEVGFVPISGTTNQVLFGTNKNNTSDVNSGRGKQFCFTGYSKEEGRYNIVVPGTGDMFCWAPETSEERTIQADSIDELVIHELRYEKLTTFLPNVYIDGVKKSFGGGYGTAQDSYLANIPLSLFCNRYYNLENRNAFGNTWYLRRICFYTNNDGILHDYIAASKSGKPGMIDATNGNFFEGTGSFEVKK